MRNVSSKSGDHADAAEVAALLFAGFVSEADAARRLGLEIGDLKLLLADLDLSNAAMVPVEIDEELNTYYVDLGRSAFDAPLFNDVVDRSRATRITKQTIRLRLPANVVLGNAATSQRSCPGGLIFHVGRCGSTLLCNLLASVPGWVTLKEPEFVNGLLLRLAAERDSEQKERLGALVALLLRSLGHGVRLDTNGRARACVVKLSSWNAILADEFIWRFDSMPLLVVTRDPWATVASFLSNPPHWYGHGPASVAALPFMRTNRVEAARFFAEAWSRTIDGVLRFPEQQTLFVDYAELVKNPLTVLGIVCLHLRNGGEDPNIGSVDKVMRQYSKDPRKERFKPQGRHHREALEPEVRDLVTAITANSWSALVTALSRCRTG